jgi:hypothetical protein
MSIQRIGNPPFPAAQLEGRMIAKIEHVWHSAMRWAKQNGYQYITSYGVIDVAPT